MTNGVSFVASEAGLRFYRVYKESGRPLPKFSDDDVIDYMVLEALTIKAWQAEEEARKKQKNKEWRRDKEKLKGNLENAGLKV